MFRKPLAAIVLLSLLSAGITRAEDATPRQVISLDAGWKFFPGDPAGAEKPEFDDSAWRTVDVPHDWSIEGAIDPRNPSGTAQAFLPMGVGWYRKVLPALPGPVANIEFDGITTNAMVYLNGKEIGERPNGYLTLRVAARDLAAGKNVLAVRVDNSVQPSSRWYAGSGITRHVRMVAASDFMLVPNATFISTLNANEKQATIQVQTQVRDYRQIVEPRIWGAKVQIDIADPSGKTVASTGQLNMPFYAAAEPQKLTIEHPMLWSTDNAAQAIYHARVAIQDADGKWIEESFPFGIRTAEFKPDGFYLNGTRTQLKGVCVHLDGGGIGAAVPMGVWERRLDTLRSLGVNAIRTSHNPPDPAFLDLLDRKGFLVMHEIFDVWNTAKVKGDYSRFFKDNWKQDLTDAVMRDRNHPCIVIYSAGNEIHDSAAAQLQLFPQLRDLYHQLDPTRPVTLAMLQADRQGGGFTNGLAGMEDVVGANYRPEQLVAYAKEHPGTKVIETETNYNANELEVFRDSPELSGEFLWTGVDYLGEGMGGIAQGFGLIDRTGMVRARGYEHQAWWTTAPMVKIARVIGPTRTNNRDLGGGRVLDWTPANQQPHNETVEVYSNCDEVELFLNDQSLGKKAKPTNVTRTWQVPFAAGKVRAIASNAGKQVATDELRTAAAPTQILLTADRKTLTTAWDDIIYVRASIADAAGTVNPLAGNLVHFEITGPGMIMALDNADLDSHEPFRGNQRSAFQGTCIAVVKATGSGAIIVKAHVDGMPEVKVDITGISAGGQ